MTLLTGQRAWAEPWVRFMQRSTLVTRLKWLVERPLAQHMAYQVGVGEKDSFIGRQVMKFDLPVCQFMGR